MIFFVFENEMVILFVWFSVSVKILFGDLLVYLVVRVLIRLIVGMVVMSILVIGLEFNKIYIMLFVVYFNRVEISYLLLKNKCLWKK